MATFWFCANSWSIGSSLTGRSILGGLGRARWPLKYRSMFLRDSVLSTTFGLGFLGRTQAILRMWMAN